MSTTDVRKPDHSKPRRHFIFEDEHDQLRDSIRRFAQKELAPHADEWEETTFPNWVFARMGELGFLGLNKPVEYGGQGGDYYTSIVLAEELVQSNSGGMTMGVAVHTEMALPPILEFGTEEQKQQWGAPAIAGEKILSIAITEPDVGSPWSLGRRLARSSTEKATGHPQRPKMYITNGLRPYLCVLVTKTYPDAGLHNGLDAVPRTDGTFLGSSA